jgi:hypothetical protein
MGDRVLAVEGGRSSIRVGDELRMSCRTLTSAPVSLVSACLSVEEAGAWSCLGSSGQALTGEVPAEVARTTLALCSTAGSVMSIRTEGAPNVNLLRSREGWDEAALEPVAVLRRRPSALVVRSTPRSWLFASRSAESSRPRWRRSQAASLSPAPRRSMRSMQLSTYAKRSKEL